MKILIVGSKKSGTLESVYSENLSVFSDVDIFPSKDIFYDYYHNNIFNKIIHILGFSFIFKKINKKLLEYIGEKKFDIIWVFKGMEILPNTLNELQKKKVLLVNYNADHPFEYFSRGSGNMNVLNGLKYYNHHFSYSKEILKRIEKDLKISNSLLPFGYMYDEKPTKKKLNKVVCFIGNPDKKRKNYIDKLIKSGIKVDVFGKNWSQFFIGNENNLKINSQVSSEDFIKVAQSYYIHLNVFRPHNFNSHNMRTFEMPALGCLMLSPYSEEQAEFFIEDEEMFFYNDLNDLISKCKKILLMSENKIFNLRSKAYRKSIENGYSYKSRAKEVYNKFEDLINS